MAQVDDQQDLRQRLDNDLDDEEDEYDQAQQAKSSQRRRGGIAHEN
jgi:hypothetical protein